MVLLATVISAAESPEPRFCNLVFCHDRCKRLCGFTNPNVSSAASRNESCTDDHADSMPSGKSAKASNLLLSAMAYVDAVVRSCLSLPESNRRVHFRRHLNWGRTANLATVKKWSVLAGASAPQKTRYDLMLRISFFVHPSLKPMSTCPIDIWTRIPKQWDHVSCKGTTDARSYYLGYLHQMGQQTPNGPTTSS